MVKGYHITLDCYISVINVSKCNCKPRLHCTEYKSNLRNEKVCYCHPSP